MDTRKTASRAGVILAAALLGAPACGAGEPPEKSPPPGKEQARPAEPDPAPGTLVPNGRMPLEGVLTGGQPSAEQLERLAGMGYRSVINLRTPGEEGSTDPAAVEALGMRYVSIPVAGAAGLTEENARKLGAAMDEAGGPVLIHCASGNRVGALLGVKASAVDGKPPAEALEIARAAGVTRLEPELREILGLAGAGAD